MRLALAAAAALAALSTAQASDLTCPATLETDEVIAGVQASYSFRYVSFFDGDPAEMTDLAPEDASEQSRIEQQWRLVRSPGRPITMVCRYHGTDRTVQKVVPDDIKECRLQGFVDSAGEVVGSPTLSCS